MTERQEKEPGTPPHGGAAEPADSLQGGGSAAVADAAQDAVSPPAAERPAPAVDPSAATPDRQPAGEKAEGMTDERPEILVAGAFAGGLLAALVLKRLARG